MKQVFSNPNEWLEANGYTSWLFKYVRFADGTVLFCDACSTYVGHKTIANAKPDVPPVFAGKIQVLGGRWCYKEGGSMTLDLPSGNSDEKYIERALEGTGLMHDPELFYSC